MQDLIMEFSKNQTRLIVESLTLAEMDMKVMLLTPLLDIQMRSSMFLCIDLLVENVDLDGAISNFSI